MFKFMVGNRFVGQYGFSALRMCAHNVGWGDAFKPPTRCNSFQLLCGVGSIASGANQSGIGPGVELTQHRVVAAIKEILHQAGNGGQCFWRGKYKAACLQQVFWACLAGVQQGGSHFVHLLGTFGHSLCHLLGASCQAVKNNQQFFHVYLGVVCFARQEVMAFHFIIAA